MAIIADRATRLARPLIVGLAVVLGLALIPQAPASAAIVSSATASSTLNPGQELLPGQSLVTGNGEYVLQMQTDGDFVLSSQSHRLWSTHTAGDDGAYAVQQTDGNLVVYLGSAPLWASNSQGHPGAVTRLGTDGSFSVELGSRVLWTTLVRSSTLNPGQTLFPGRALSSGDGSYRLVMQGDGNLVLYSASAALWSSGTAGHAGARAVQQGDGNLVLYFGGTAIWSSATTLFPGAATLLGDSGTIAINRGGALVRYLYGSNTLGADQKLLPGWSISSPNQVYRLVMQTDGNLVIYGAGPGAAWASRTDHHPGAYAVVQPDGNLVIYQGHSVLWAAGTNGYGFAYARLDNDGRLVVFSAVGAPVWWRDRGLGDAVCGGVGSDPNGTTITRWNPVTLCVLTVLDQSLNELGDVNTIINYESGGNPNAINLTDINYQEGHPSEGLIQVIKPTFNRFRSLQLSADLFNPAANLYAGLNYAIYTYGSIHNVPGLVSLRDGGPYVGYVIRPAA